MSKPKGYWIGHVGGRNAERYPDYVKAAQPAYKKYGAKFIVRGGEYDAVEGNARRRHVVVEFGSFEQAIAYYNSSEYQAAAKIRRENSEGETLIAEGAE